MDDLTHHVIGSSAADVRAAEAVEQHHAAMSGRLGDLVETLAAAVRAGDPAAAERARDEVVRWSRGELVPHALAEETTMYAAAGAMPEGRLLVEAMLAEHRAVVALVGELDTTTETVGAVGLARALQALFEVHLAKENDQVLPLLVSAPTVSVADLLGGMHELLGGGTTSHSSGHTSGHACGCGETDGPELPELDARAIPHAIRHATIFGALDGVRPGGGLVLVAPHDPLPMLAQLERREPGVFRVDYLERGPEAWRLTLVRQP